MHSKKRPDFLGPMAVKSGLRNTWGGGRGGFMLSENATVLQRKIAAIAIMSADINKVRGEFKVLQSQWPIDG